MGSIARLIFGLPGAALMTALLFLIMSNMIRQDVQLDEVREAMSIDITQQLKDTALNSSKQIQRPTLDTPPRAQQPISGSSARRTAASTGRRRVRSNAGSISRRSSTTKPSGDAACRRP